MADKPFVRLETTSMANGDAELAPGSDGLVEWRSDSGSAKPFNISKLEKLAREYTLCVAGKAMALLSEEQFSKIVPLVTVFARVSPQQKEQVVVALNKLSHTMMVGDGTNDVG